MDGLDRLSDIIDTLLKDINKYETADGTKNAIKYFYNEKEKVLKNYIEYFVDKELEK